MGIKHSKPKKGGKGRAVEPNATGASKEKALSPSSMRARKQGSATITGFTGDVAAKYHVESKVLGEGHYGTVRRCQDRESGEWYALKTIKKAKVKRADYLRREIDMLLTVNHPNIINVVDVFEDNFNLQIVCELCTGGELFDSIIEKSKSAEGHYSEQDASTIIRKVLSAIDHCHSDHDIVHRDLKPENFLFKGPGKGEGEPVIIDFGLSKMNDNPNDHMATRVGTPYYIAPEVLGRDYTKACDLWSIGVITYILLCGYPPFYGDNDAAIFRMIMSGRFDFPEQEWGDISQEAKDFIKRLINLEADERPTAAEAMNDPWFTYAHAAPVPITAAVGSRLESFVSMGKLKKHALHVIAENLTESEISNIKDMFVRLDVDRSGTLTVEELKSALTEFPQIHDQIEELVEGIDLDGNESVDYKEFLAATLSRNVFIREENIQVAFNHFDQGNKGKITVSDLVGIFGSEQHAQEVMGAIDIDGDMTISYEEFKIMMLEHTQGAKTLHHTDRDPNYGKGAEAK